MTQGKPHLQPGTRFVPELLPPDYHLTMKRASEDEVEEVPVEQIEVNLPGPSGHNTQNELERVLACEQAIGYEFSDKGLLRNALTHSSSTSDKRLDNERLEFFGDAVLDLVIREYLFHNYPNRQEGDLTEAKSAVVCRDALVRAAQRLGLKNYLNLGRGIGKRRAVPDSLLANAYEAVVAAIYLDGGYEPVRDFILTSLRAEIPRAIEEANSTNYKSNLQKMVQQQKKPLPVYKVLSTSGPEHSRTFQVAVLIDGEEMGRGSGSSKKTAEQQAAKSALETYAQSG
ncbi:MAG: ribonuclease III [Planctomycetes bacterium]|nr:ribonuclease III [Planctomycetota bacterium]